MNWLQFNMIVVNSVHSHPSTTVFICHFALFYFCSPIKGFQIVKNKKKQNGLSLLHNLIIRRKSYKTVIFGGVFRPFMAAVCFS